MDWKTWMQDLNYTNPTRFLYALQQWINLNGQIPYRFLENIGTDIESLEKVLGEDFDAYESALANAVLPKQFQVRIFPCIYPVVDLPDYPSENQAVDYVIDFLNTSVYSYKSDLSLLSIFLI